MVGLDTIMEVVDSSAPRVIERHNFFPSGRITANLAEGASLRGVKSLCETLADREFGAKQFKVVRLTR